MHELAGESRRLSSQRKDERILKYLRRQIRRCRDNNLRWARMYYEYGWEFASDIIYGPLPARDDFSTGESPSSIVSAVPAGFRSQHPVTQWPLKKIIKRFSREWNSRQIEYETLECSHIFIAPVGWSAPNKSRRCPACLVEKLAAKKKPAVSIAEVPRKKAVSA
jgi:hypothetical protein